MSIVRVLICAAVALPLTLPGPAKAAISFGECDFAMCYVRGDGASVSGVDHVPAGSTVSMTGGGRHIPSKPAKFESTMTPACPGNDPNAAGAYDMSCQTLVSACEAVGLAGPLTWWWSRPLNPDGSPGGPWVRTGQSCQVPAAQVAAAAARPVLTEAAIRVAFRQVAFSLPQVHVQPEGNVTLVNLPTFFAVRWPERGVQPGEVVTVDILGRSVRVRPLATSFVYRFGDGSQWGPTADAGGVYPEGTVRHAYTAPATVMARVSVTYGGQFSVDGGPWRQVAETITLTGPTTGVQVLEARARLEAG